MKRDENNIPQFEESDIQNCSWDGKNYYHFEAAMISTCQPLFDGLDSNHEVEDKLRNADVIRSSTAYHTDTESCALVINFETKDSGHRFIHRLNAYLRKKAELQRRAKEY